MCSKAISDDCWYFGLIVYRLNGITSDPLVGYAGYSRLQMIGTFKQQEWTFIKNLDFFIILMFFFFPAVFIFLFYKSLFFHFICLLGTWSVILFCFCLCLCFMYRIWPWQPLLLPIRLVVKFNYLVRLLCFMQTLQLIYVHKLCLLAR